MSGKKDAPTVKATIPDRQKLLLEKRAEYLGISLSELVRRIIDDYLESRVQGGNNK